MADRNHPNIDDQVGVADDDPFAELTRIMGFDPRQPVEPAGGEQEAIAARAEDDGDGFNIDLEKELMGEFDAEEYHDRPARDEASEHAADDFELDLADDFDEALAVASEEDLVGASEPAPDVDDGEPELGLVEDFDAALAISEEEEQAGIAAVPADQEPEIEPGLAEQSGNAPVTTSVAEPFEEPEFTVLEDDEIELDLDGHFDEALAAAVEADRAHSSPDAEGVRQEMEPESTANLDAAADDEDPRIAAIQDSEAEIELDLTDDFHDAFVASVAAEAMREDDDWRDASRINPAAAEAGFVGRDEAVLGPGGNEQSADEEAAEEQVAFDEPAAEPANEFETPVEDNELQFGDDFDGLEDELAAEFDTGPESAGDEAPVTDLPALPTPPVDFTETDFGAVEPVSTEPDTSEADVFKATESNLEDELNALLGNSTVSTPAAQPAQVGWVGEPADTFSVEAHAGDLADETELDWELDSAEFGDHDLPDFDHAALDEAIAKGVDAEAPRDAEYRDDPPEAAATAYDEVHTAPREDPLHVIAALTARYATPLPVSYGQSDFPAHQQADPVSMERSVDYQAAEPFESAPEIETIEVHDKAVALADDLDIPELAYDERRPQVAAYDDLDAEFAGLLDDMNAGEPAPRRTAADTYDDDLARGSEAGVDDDGRMSGYVAQAPVAATYAGYDDDIRAGHGFPTASENGGVDDGASEFEAGDYGYDPEFDGAAADPRMNRDRAPLRRRGMLIAAVVGGVALVGGFGAFALSFGGGGDDASVLVRADDSPVKVKPENPGGTTVPNQDNKVYETVAGAGTVDDPQQERLVTTAEEPVDVTPPAPEPQLAELAPAQGEEAAPQFAEAPVAPSQVEAPVNTAKNEDRIAQILQEDQADLDMRVAAIAPRKVRTLVVRPDGTLVPREDPEPVVEPQAEATEVLTEPAAAAPAVPAATATTSGFTTPGGGTVATPVSAAPGEQASTPLSQQPVFPDSVPVAPQRPADQPVEVVGEVKAGQVAALGPAASAGSWSMQIASQPSEAAARSSYQNLARRYGSVLDGRQANIVKAEIAGKGTFWRVRVPTESRNEAISLCESYKVAGGNCFVSR